MTHTAKVSIYGNHHAPEDVLFSSSDGPVQVLPLAHPCRNAPVCEGRVEYVGGRCLDCRESITDAQRAGFRARDDR